MSGKERNTDPTSPRLFECEYTTIVLGDDYGEVSSELRSGELLDLLEPIHDACSSPPQGVMPTLSEKEREKMMPLIRKVSTILFDSDPMCLNFGYNRDEYDPEAVTIVSMLKDRKSVDEEIDVIIDTFRHWFDQDLTEYKIDRKVERMVKRIGVVWSEYQDYIKRDDNSF